MYISLSYWKRLHVCFAFRHESNSLIKSDDLKYCFKRNSLIRRFHTFDVFNVNVSVCNVWTTQQHIESYIYLLIGRSEKLEFDLAITIWVINLLSCGIKYSISSWQVNFQQCKNDPSIWLWSMVIPPLMYRVSILKLTKVSNQEKICHAN